MEKAASYLENFWNPSPGHKVVVGDSQYEIDHFEEGHSEQVYLKGQDFIYFIQDLDWDVKLEDGLSILVKLGVTVNIEAKLLAFGRTFQPLPTTLKEVVDAIKYFRHFGMISGGGDILTKEYYEV